MLLHWNLCSETGRWVQDNRLSITNTAAFVLLDLKQMCKQHNQCHQCCGKTHQTRIQISWTDIQWITQRKYTVHHVRTYHHNSRVAAWREAAKIQVLGFFGPAELAAALEQVSAGLFRARLVPANEEGRERHKNTSAIAFLKETWCPESLNDDASKSGLHLKWGTIHIIYQDIRIRINSIVPVCTECDSGASQLRAVELCGHNKW